MEATTAAQVGRIHPRRGFSGKLEPGDYRLLLRSVRRSNELPYAMVLSSKELLVGQQKALTAPGAVQVSVGSRGWIDLSSFGRSDVRARLELDGAIVAANDDRPEDWNFQLQQRVDPGVYTLFVEPVGQSQASTTVRFNAPQEQLQAPLKPGRSVSVRTKKDALLFPLEVGEARVIALSIDSPEK